MAGFMNFKDPGALATGVIFIVVALKVLVEVLPDLIDSIIQISVVPNLGFASFFQANGVVLLLLSVGILIAVFGVIGVKRASGSSKR